MKTLCFSSDSALECRSYTSVIYDIDYCIMSNFYGIITYEWFWNRIGSFYDGQKLENEIITSILPEEISLWTYERARTFMLLFVYMFLLYCYLWSRPRIYKLYHFGMFLRFHYISDILCKSRPCAHPIDFLRGTANTSEQTHKPICQGVWIAMSTNNVTGPSRE